MEKNIFWLVGEKSGDLHASSVLRYCNTIHPDWNHTGVGGRLMEKEGFESLFPFSRFNVMGFVEVIKHLKFFNNVERKIEQLFKQNPPDSVVLVDYPGLNMRIAKLAKSLNIPVVYYICPQFWAWKKHRIFQLRDYSDAIGYILPFEGNYFEDSNIEATYTGHPISEEIMIQSTREEFSNEFELDNEAKWIAFFPGSRDNEIKKLLPVYLKAMKTMQDKGYQFLLSRADTITSSIFEEYLNSNKISNLKVIEGRNYEMMRHADFVCVKSGTTTLETAWLGTPFILCYKTNWLSYLIGKFFIKINWIGLPNIILNKSVIPELIQKEANADNIRSHIERYLNDNYKYEEIKDELQYLHDILGKKSASQEVTKMIEVLVR